MDGDERQTASLPAPVGGPPSLALVIAGPDHVRRGESSHSLYTRVERCGDQRSLGPEGDPTITSESASFSKWSSAEVKVFDGNLPWPR